MSLPAPTPAGFLAAAKTGTRVVVRYRIPEGFTAALGDLVACDAGSVTVQTRQAAVVIPLGAVVAAKSVPPAPPRRRPRS